MAGIADLNVRIGASVKDFERGMQQIERRIARFQRTFENIGTNLTQSLTLPLAALGAASVQAFGDFESLERAFAAVAAEGTNVAEEIERLRKVAEAPGLGFNEAVRASTRLQAVGISARQAEEIITQYGNAVARSGGGAEAFDGAILALTQIASKGKISAEEINQLNERIFEIRPALQAAFGTADSEQLEKLGISSEEFIARTTAEFAKLERVQGGLSNSFENLRDSLRTSLSEFGRAINQSINLNGLFERLANAVQSAVDRFKSLTPEAQAFIVKALAVTVAIGPLLLGIAKLASLGTLATQGLSLIGGSIAKLAVLLGPTGLAIGAVVVGITALVAKYRELNPTVDTYNDYLSENTKQLIGQKSELNGLFTALTDSNTSQSTRSRLIGEINSKYKDYLPQLIKEGDSIDRIKIAQAAANTEFEKKIRLAALEGVLEKQKEKLVQLAEEEYRLEVQLANAKKNTADANKQLFSGLVAGGAAGDRQINSAVNQVSALEELRRKLSNVKDAQNELTNAAKNTQSALDATLNTLTRPISAAPAAPGLPTFPRTPTSKPGKVLTDEQQIKKEIDSIIKQFSGLNALDGPLTLKPQIAFNTGEVQVLGEKLKTAFAQSIGREAFEDTVELARGFELLKLRADEFNAGLSNVRTPGKLIVTLGEAALAAGEAMAELARQGELSLRALGKAALRAATDFLRAKIIEGVAAVVSDALKKFGLLGLAIGAAAGAAAGALFSGIVAKISTPKLAKGGLAYAPTLATVGDNPNARVDPEVIAPLSKLRSILGDAGGGNLVAEARISGNDLLLLVERAQLRQNRVR